MTAPNETFKIRPTKGMAPDLPAWEVSDEYWTAGFNILFRDGFASRNFGHSEVYATPLAKPSYLISLTDAGRNFWIYCGDSTVHVAEGAVHSDISYAGQSAVSYNNAWTGSLLNGLVVLNNGADPPAGWNNNPANVMTELPGWPVGTVVKAMRSHKFYLFGFDVTDGGGQFRNRVMWSDSADPGTYPASWTPAIDNDAGFVDLASDEAPIVDGASLRDVLIIYKNESVWAADFVGGNSIWTFRLLFSSSGLLNRNCWAEFEANHVFMSDSDVFLTDGFNVKSIADKKVRRFIKDNVDANNIGNAFLCHNLDQNEVWINFPSVGKTTCDTAAVYAYRDDTWGFRSVPNILHAASGIISDVVPSDIWDDQTAVPADIWDNRGETWNTQGFSLRADGLLMAAYDDTKLQLVDEGTDFDGMPVASTLLLSKNTLGDPDRNKLIKRIWPKFDKLQPSTSVSIRIGASDRVQGAESFTPTKLFNIGVDTYLDFTHQGKYITIEISSLTNNAWRLTGMDVEYRLSSYF